MEAAPAAGCSHPPALDGATVNGVRIDPVTEAFFLQRLEAFLRCGRSHVVHFIPADPTVIARRDPAYRAVLDRADLNVPDGMSVVWALRLQGLRARRLAGADAMRLVAGRGRAWSARHYLFGGTPGTVERLRRTLLRAYPGIRIAGAESPPFTPLSPDRIREAAGRIRAAGADVLWVGLGAPKQDLVADALRAHGAAPAILCVGAAFDFLAGTKRRAPAWMRRAGLEWLHRLASEPRRLWRRYLIGGPRFVAGVAADRLRSRRRS